MLSLAGRRLLQLITHPVVLFVLLAGSIYAVWFLTDKSAKVAMSALSALAELGIGRFYYATNRVNRALREVQEGRDHAWSPQLENEQVLLRTALRSTEILPSDVETY